MPTLAYESLDTPRRRVVRLTGLLAFCSKLGYTAKCAFTEPLILLTFKERRSTALLLACERVCEFHCLRLRYRAGRGQCLLGTLRWLRRARRSAMARSGCHGAAACAHTRTDKRIAAERSCVLRALLVRHRRREKTARPTSRREKLKINLFPPAVVK